MENEKIVVLQLKLSRKHCLFALAFAFLCFHPRPLGSETLTLTTYYPAPYGGYVAILTTGGNAGNPVNTLLVRDAGTVGIGTSAPDPGVILDVNGLVRIRGDGSNDIGQVLTAVDTSGTTVWADAPGGCYWQPFAYPASTDCTATGYAGPWTVTLVRTTAAWLPECLKNDTSASCQNGAKELLSIDSTNSSSGVIVYSALPAGTLLPLTGGRLMPLTGEMLCCEIEIL